MKKRIIGATLITVVCALLLSNLVGALMFLGCPLRMVIRLGGGDGNAIIGLVGFIAGIFGGTLFLKKGFTLKKSQPQAKIEGALMPAVSVALLVLAELVMVAGYFVTEWLLLGYGLAAAAGAVVPNLVQGFSGVVLGAMLIPLLRRVTPPAMRL